MTGVNEVSSDAFTEETGGAGDENHDDRLFTDLHPRPASDPRSSPCSLAPEVEHVRKYADGNSFTTCL
jgi:hypothetical protein